MTRVSEEYAAALFTLAAEEGVKREVAEAVEVIRTLMDENPDYVELLAAPNIPFDERSALIDAALGSLQEYAVNFVKLMTKNGHVRELADCIGEYLKLWEHADGIITAEVVSAAPLTEAQQDALRAGLEAKLSRRVTLSLSVDPSLLGGMIISVDGSVMDGSLRTKLAQMKEAISE